MSNFYDYFTENKDKLHLHIITLDEVDIMVREITWKEGLLIDAKSFRKKDNIVYQNSEFEKREILNIAILRAYDTNTNTDFRPDFDNKNGKFKNRIYGYSRICRWHSGHYYQE